ncbi:hydrogenase 3 maturation protease [Methanolinea mesophila]|uniref:hydrogenase maturation peptidase HycI n=1 Tax=Methanolinea mesophila TaxID=547055 RepID=UPI001AEA927C|nr:hydrogenase maturation peptidase HycI [Methanolinea mesophila]MBP1929637.1 hydrogenase 3 maturation protease [Methanolinea mesophila]
MNVLMGIGNTLLGDDGVGSYIASRFRDDDWTVFDCGTVPENFTSPVRKVHPGILILVDAAEMGLTPGEFRVVPPDRIADVSIGTHALPLSHLIDYLSPDAGRIVFVGIQPESMIMGDGLSPAVKEGADRFMDLLREGSFREILEYDEDQG